MKLSDRITKLELKLVGRQPSRRIEQHIVRGDTDAERQAKIAAIVAAGSGNVLHVFRTIVRPGEDRAAS